MDDLTDEELACWVREDIAHPLNSALLELQRHSAAIAADKERVRAVVREVAEEVLRSDGVYGYSDRIAKRAAEQLASPAVRLTEEERNDLVNIRSIISQLAKLADTEAFASGISTLDRLLGASR